MPAEARSGGPATVDPFQGYIPSFLIEAALQPELGISADDTNAEPQALTPELKEMFQLYTNVEVD